MTLECAKRLKVGVVDTVMPVKVNFAQGSYQEMQVANGVWFKVDGNNFEEDFTICELGGVDIVLANIYLYYLDKDLVFIL